jgi:hypothetical protein
MQALQTIYLTCQHTRVNDIQVESFGKNPHGWLPCSTGETARKRLGIPMFMGAVH